MITAMNKYLFLIYHREYEAFLEKLRTIGVVHIRETKARADMLETLVYQLTKTFWEHIDELGRS